MSNNRRIKEKNCGPVNKVTLVFYKKKDKILNIATI